MSIIQNIRERGTWIILGFIAAALIAFILQDGVGRNSKNNDTTTLGVINGEKINKIDFEQKVQSQIQAYSAQGQNAPRGQVINNLWDNELFTILIKQEAEKIGLTVGTKEINDVLFGPESPFRQQFTDKNTGEFKVNDLKTALAGLKKSTKKEDIDQRESVEKNQIQPAIEKRLTRKYQVLLYKGVQTPKWLAEKQFAENNAISNIRFVQVPYTTIADTTVKVTDEDVTAYLKENSASFQIEENQRTVNYVKFSAAPVAADSLKIKNNILALQAEFKTTTDNAAFLTKAGSLINYENTFLNKEVYTSKLGLTTPQVDSILKSPVGGTVGPFVFQNTMTVVKYIGSKQRPDSASVRHILISTVDLQTRQTIRDDSAAKKLIDSIKTAITGGASFESMVEKYSDDPGSKSKGGVYELFPQGTMVKPFNDFTFDNAVGSKGVVKTEFGYHYIEVLKQTKPNSVYNLAFLTLPIEASKETIQAAQTEASKFASTSKDLKSFKTNALKLNKQIEESGEIRAEDFNIRGVQEESREAVRWIFDKKVNDVSEPLEIGNSYYVMAITREDKPGLMSTETAKGIVELEAIIRNKKKAETIKAKLKGTTLETIATAVNATVLQADSLRYSKTNITGLGNEPKLVGAAFNKSLLNKVSEPIAGNAGVFVISVSNQGAIASPFDLNMFKEQLQGKTSNTFVNSYIALKKTAKIEDNRAKLY
jgi:peptidyl-prolyl cis-trans isomerase D